MLLVVISEGIPTVLHQLSGSAEAVCFDDDIDPAEEAFYAGEDDLDPAEEAFYAGEDDLPPDDDAGAGEMTAAPSRREPAPGTPEAAGGAAAVNPAIVTRRVKWQRGGVGLDWLQGTGEACWLETVRDKLAETFGEYSEGAGGMFYRTSYKYAGGVRLYYGVSREVRETFCVVVPGGALSPMSADDRVELLRVLAAFGMKFTRIDVARDFFCEDGVGLVDAVFQSCDAECLVGPRRWELRRPRGRGRYMGNSVYLGRRGRYGSGKMVRVYDKGLETQTRPMGQWERWETQFDGQAAALVGETLAGAEDWAAEALKMTFGVCDFRAAAGRSDRHLRRRRRLDWWQAFTDEVLGVGVEGVRVKALPVETRLESVEAWLRLACVRTIRVMARIKGCDTVEAFGELLRSAPEEFKEEWLLRPWAWQLYQRERRRLEVQEAAARSAGVPF